MTTTAVMACAAIYLALLLGKWAGAQRAVRESDRASRHGDVRAVTVLTPILSGDPDLPSVLAHQATALQDARLVWLVDHDDVEGQRIAAAVREAHPEASIVVVECAAPLTGRNPKTAKLTRGSAHVQTPLLLVLDDDARLPRESLRQMVGEAGTADLVTALPYYREPRAGAGRLLAAFVNNNAALTYLSLLPWRAPVTLNGMCYLLHTADWQRRGGFAPLETQLTDDLAVATAMRRSGGRLCQSTARVEMHTTVASLARYTAQMHRWHVFALLLLREQPVLLRVLIAMLFGVPPLLLVAIAAGLLRSPAPVAVVAGATVLVVRSAVLRSLQRQLTGQARHHAAWSMLSELLQPLHLLHAAVSRRIRWRSRTYLVRANDDFEPA